MPLTDQERAEWSRLCTAIHEGKTCILESKDKEGNRIVCGAIYEELESGDWDVTPVVQLLTKEESERVFEEFAKERKAKLPTPKDIPIQRPEPEPELGSYFDKRYYTD